MVDAGIRYVVMEVSSQALKLDRVSGFTYDYGIFTNLEGGPHWRGGAPGHGGLYPLQGPAVPAVQGGSGQRRRRLSDGGHGGAHL